MKIPKTCSWRTVAIGRCKDGRIIDTISHAKVLQRKSNSITIYLNEMRHHDMAHIPMYWLDYQGERVQTMPTPETSIQKLAREIVAKIKARNAILT